VDLCSVDSVDECLRAYLDTVANGIEVRERRVPADAAADFARNGPAGTPSARAASIAATCHGVRDGR
jgi:hypothetical protein